MLSFEWDEAKNDSNHGKHGVVFADAETVFYDRGAIEFYDDTHSEHEDRFLLLGLSASMRILLVCYSLRMNGTVIRIISARKATKNERRLYPHGAS